jgi:uncharacterized protein
MRPLTPIEARVLGTLMEKARTVPDSYPLSLNALVTGCNQKTSRDPLMDVSDDDARSAIDSLKALSLVFEGSSSRVPRFEHNAVRALQVSEAQATVIGLLLLRGPQTPAELRTNGERWYKFADSTAVETTLQELHQRGEDGGPRYVIKLPKAPGAREARWMHLICGEVDVQALSLVAAASPSDEASLVARITVLENQVTALKANNSELATQIQQIAQQLGIELPANAVQS